MALRHECAGDEGWSMPTEHGGCAVWPRHDSMAVSAGGRRVENILTRSGQGVQQVPRRQCRIEMTPGRG